MKSLISFFLKVKPWQLFLLLVATYSFGIIVMERYLRKLPLHNSPMIALCSEVVMSPFLLCLMGWLWSVGSFLFSHSRVLRLPSFLLFRIATLVSTAYFLTLFVLNDLDSNSQKIWSLFVFFAWCCVVYMAYFVSRRLVMVEKGVVIRFKDYRSTLAAFLMGIFAVMAIQPRINRLNSAG